MEIVKLRNEFPVTRSHAYLNAGTDGPLPAAAVRAAATELEQEAEHGRAHLHFERRGQLSSELRSAYASILGSPAEHIALTCCTSEGIAQVIAGLRLRAGDEIVTSDEEHPGLLGALAAAQELHGARIRMVAFADVAAAVGPATKLVAVSHVGWMSGSVAPAELAQVALAGGGKVPVLLDGAQGVGAVPTDVMALCCDAYAGAGQKWLCGPDGTGMLYTTPLLRERLAVERRGYGNQGAPDAGLQAGLHEDARRFDAMSLNAETLACALAAARVLGEAGWPAVHERACELAALLVERLPERGREVAPRGEGTLVSFSSADPPGERAALAEQGVILRNIPDRPWLRASVGAWNDERDIERLLGALAA